MLALCDCVLGVCEFVISYHAFQLRLVAPPPFPRRHVWRWFCPSSPPIYISPLLSSSIHQVKPGRNWRQRDLLVLTVSGGQWILRCQLVNRSAPRRAMCAAWWEAMVCYCRCVAGNGWTPSPRFEQVEGRSRTLDKSLVFQ